MTSVNTAAAIVRGTAKKYDAEYKAILDVLRSDETDVRVPNIQTRPVFFGDLQIQSDSNYWINRDIAKYFHKKTVRLKTN